MKAFPSSALEIKPRPALGLLSVFFPSLQTSYEGGSVFHPCQSPGSIPGSSQAVPGSACTGSLCPTQGRHRGDQMELMLFNSPRNTSSPQESLSLLDNELCFTLGLSYCCRDQREAQMRMQHRALPTASFLHSKQLINREPL